jgi:hypothetical protein
MKYEIGALYFNDNDGSVVQLVNVEYEEVNHLCTIYLMKYIKKGKYPSLNKSNHIYYVDSSFERCRKLTKEEKLAILL